MFKVKSQIEFDMAHYLSGYDGNAQIYMAIDIN